MLAVFAEAVAKEPMGWPEAVTVIAVSLGGGIAFAVFLYFLNRDFR